MEQLISIAQAEIKDIAAIRSTAFEIWPQVYAALLSPEQISYMMDMMYSCDVIRSELESGVKWFIVKSGNDIAGYASIYDTVFDGVPAVKLDKLYLKECFRSRGIGRQLLSHLVQESKKAGASRMILNVNKYNTPAQSAYKRWGFTLAKSEVNDIGNGFVMDDFVFALDI